MDEVLIASKVKSVMSKVFGVNESEIDENSSQDTVLKWDSLGHLNLVVALEEEFSIQLSDEQVLELLNYKLVYLTVKDLVS